MANPAFLNATPDSVKTIELYKIRKRLIYILFLVCCALILAYFLTADWEDPNWLLLASLSMNAFMVGSIGLNYRNTTLKLLKDQILFRTMGKKKGETILVNDQSEFSKDWKGIYVKNGNELQKIPLEYMGRKEGEALFNEIREYYLQGRNH